MVSSQTLSGASTLNGRSRVFDAITADFLEWGFDRASCFVPSRETRYLPTNHPFYGLAEAACQVGSDTERLDQPRCVIPQSLATNLPVFFLFC